MKPLVPARWHSGVEGCAWSLFARLERSAGLSRNLEREGRPRAALEAAGRKPVAKRRLRGYLRAHDPNWAPHPRRPLRPGRHPGRVLFLLESSLPYVAAGYSVRSRTLMFATQDAGGEPVALTRLGFPASRGMSAKSSMELIDGIRHHRLTLPGLRHYTAMPLDRLVEANAVLAAAVARRERPEVIWASSPHINGLVGLALSRRLGVPFVYDVRGFPEMTWLAAREPGELFSLRREAETRCMREADAVVVLSEAMRREIEDRGIDQRPVVIPHAVGPSAPTSGGEKVGWGKPVDRPPCLIGAVASLRELEGLECLLHAAAELRGKPELSFVIAGDGPASAELRQLAHELGLEGKVRFTGPLSPESASALYRTLDIAVVPRVDAAVCRSVAPLKAIEAMAAGCCLVASDLPPLRELLGDGERGALVSPGDSRELAETLLSLSAAPDLRARLGEGAARWARIHNSPQRLAAEMEQLLAALRGDVAALSPGHPLGLYKPNFAE